MLHVTRFIKTSFAYSFLRYIKFKIEKPSGVLKTKGNFCTSKYPPFTTVTRGPNNTFQMKGIIFDYMDFIAKRINLT